MKKKIRKQKYNYSNKFGTFKTRWDYIESDYINGVVDEDGKQVIRPLNKEEQDFLAKFYKEEVHSKLDQTEEIRLERKKLQALKFNYRSYKKNGNKVKHPDVIAQEEKLSQLLKDAGNWNYSTEDQKRLNKTNNDRNACIYNKAKASSALYSTNYDVDIDGILENDGIDDQIERLNDRLELEEYLEESLKYGSDKSKKSS